jgi:hypothetical protein
MLFFLKPQQLHTQNQDNFERTCKTPHIHLRIVTTIWLLPKSLISTTPNHSKKQTTVSNILSVFSSLLAIMIATYYINGPLSILSKQQPNTTKSSNNNNSLQKPIPNSPQNSFCHVTPKKFCISSLLGLSRPPVQTLVP